MTDIWAQAEGERVQANLIRVGVITQVDVAQRRAKMKVGGLDTDWLPWGVARAGGTRTASAPTVGEQRLLFSPYGDTGQGVIGQAIYQDDHDAPTESADVDVTEYPDGSRVEYDSASNTLTVTVAGDGNVIVNCQQATIAAADSVTVDTPTCTITGDLVVGGAATFNGASVTHDGKNIGKDHRHSGVETGGGNTGVPT